MTRIFVETKAVHSENRRHRILNLTVLLVLYSLFLLLCLGQNAYSADVKLAWDPNKEPDLAGYEIHYGNATGNYTSSVDVGKVTTCTVPGLVEGKTYYFAAKAYNAAGLDSGFSNEVSYTPPVSCTYSISPTSQSFSASGGTGSVAVTTQGSCNWSASTSAAWISIVSGKTGEGSGTLSYTVAANTDTAQRTASMTIAGRIFTISQAGIPTCSISATAGTGGTISPSGSVSVTAGSSKTFTFVPNAGYKTADVKVDGTSIGAVSSYTFSGVTADHSIAAGFALVPPASYTLTATAGSGGTISPSGSVSVTDGSSETFTISPNAGYKIADVKVDGTSVGAVGSCTFSNVTANHSIAASFALVPPASYVITAAAGTGGGISPSGSVSVIDGSSETFTISPNAGYKIADVKVDGTSIGAVGSYTFSNLKANHSITATFAALTTTTNAGFIIKATAGPGGNIYQSGNIVVGSGASKTFYILPKPGYVIADVKVDGVSIGKVWHFMFRYVTANHTIDAGFSPAQ